MQMNPGCGLLRFLRRSYSAQSEIFDRLLKTRQRNNFLTNSESEYYDYIRVETASRLVDRLDDISRTFPRALDLGCHRGHILKSILKESDGREQVLGGITSLVQTDISENACRIASQLGDSQTRLMIQTQVVDEEFLPFDDSSFDLVMSSMVMHWINDIPLFLRQVRKILKPDGAFIGSMLGGSTLQELSHCFYLAEQERNGGFSPHCSPFAAPSDVASLMQAAGFNLPTIDVDTLTVRF